jgi:predicted nucleotidyltransferase
MESANSARNVVSQPSETQRQVTDIVNRCRKALARHYGTQFKGLVLYGSAARRQDTPSSDIDLLVLLSAPFDYFLELRCIVDLLYPVQLESERLISAKPAAVGDFEDGRFQLYRNARREGTLV